MKISSDLHRSHGVSDRELRGHVAPFASPPVATPLFVIQILIKTTPIQILLYPQDNLSPVPCQAPVSRAWWTSSTGHVTVTRAVPRQWWSTWPEDHSRGMAPVVATSKGQSRPPGRRPLLAYSSPSPSSHGSEMAKSDRRGLILTKPKTKHSNNSYSGIATWRGGVN